MERQAPDCELRVRPRVLRVDLDRSERASTVPWRGTSEGIDRVGRLSGVGLAAALLHEHEVAHPGSPAPLVLAIGDCVRRALPTAARACVASRAPLTGFYADGQVGSDLGRRLASVADALVLTGRAREPGACLHVSGSGADTRIELRSFPALAGANPAEIQRVLARELGPCATLRTGRAGARGIPFASLAAGEDPPSFVGRGGLGAKLGELGLSAIAISSPPVEPVDEAQDLVRLLASSPRLRARAAEGTFEQADAFVARGDLRGKGYGDPWPEDRARAWKSDLPAPEASRKGCEGCPTPCGWVFARGIPGRQGARFGALYALGPNLGLERAEDALTLLAFCDDAAIDAIEAGAALALLGRGRDRSIEDWLKLLEDLVDRRGDGALLALGASRMAREIGLESEVLEARGQSARRESSLAAVLGQCASARGADPMRTFPFLLTDASGTRLAELLAPIALPEGAHDPSNPSGKGRIVWWHENLMAGLDASGFCAFSAAGLLADGVCGLDDLARALSFGSGRSLLAGGASILLVVRDLNRRWGARSEDDQPAWARESLREPGLWPEYSSWRGLDASGGPSARAWELLGEDALLDLAGASGSEPIRASKRLATKIREHGRVHLRCHGPLARELGATGPADLVEVETDLPASLREVLAAAARDHPRARRHLLQRGAPVPAAYRVSRRLDPEDPVEAGDILDLVVALTGGRTLS
ncbi:MAG: aldehyde ferredoxin oxidoreductase C-terminal domain-containing protein [Planctomycetota bacterium]